MCSSDLDKQVTLTLTDDARTWLAEHGYDAAMGARPMARLVETKLKKPIAKALVYGDLPEGGTVQVLVEADDIVLRFEAGPPKGANSGAVEA